MYQFYEFHSHPKEIFRIYCCIYLRGVVPSKVLIKERDQSKYSLMVKRLIIDFYRAQRSWAKVIFSQASVCPQGGFCLSACWDIPRLDQTSPDQTPHPPGADTPWTRPPQSRHPPDQTPPREQTPPGSRLQNGQLAAGTHPTGMQSC